LELGPDGQVVVVSRKVMGRKRSMFSEKKAQWHRFHKARERTEKSRVQEWRQRGRQGQIPQDHTWLAKSLVLL
jgi:hypothetical protein